MNDWTAFIAYYVLALAIASGVMVWSVRSIKKRPETARVMPGLFPWLEDRNTYANAVSIAGYARTAPAAWGILVFAAAPTISALVVASIGTGDAWVGSVLASLSPWRPGHSTTGALLTYVVIVVVLVLVSEVYIAQARRPDAVLPALMRSHRGVRLRLRLLGGTFIDEGGTCEELGWRAFALPVLIAATDSPITATIMVAVLWWGWHLPRDIPHLLRHRRWNSFARQQAPFVLLCGGLSTLMTAAWWHTGSVWPAVMIHGGTNVWSKAISAPMYQRTSRDIRTWIVVTLAAVVALIAMVAA